MNQFVAFVCSFSCAAALLGSSGNLAPETQEERTGAVHGVVPENKAPAEIGCQIVRYAVRYGKDNDADLVDLSAFTQTTVEDMRSWLAPSITPALNRISPYETTVLALEATLIEYRQERSLGGSDYSLVLADESGRTIIAKIVSEECSEKGTTGEPGSELPESRFMVGIVSTRADFATRLSPTTTAERVSIPIRVLGIGFFDPLTGQDGEAPNGIELCPVLAISFDEERVPVVHAPVPHHPHGGVAPR